MTERSKALRCLACSETDHLIEHHVAGRTVAPLAVIKLCERCHVELHRRHSKLWRNPAGQPESFSRTETVRLGILRLAETLIFIAETHDGRFATDVIDGVDVAATLLYLVVNLLDLLAGRLLPGATEDIKEIIS